MPNLVASQPPDPELALDEIAEEFLVVARAVTCPAVSNNVTTEFQRPIQVRPAIR